MTRTRVVFTVTMLAGTALLGGCTSGLFESQVPAQEVYRLAPVVTEQGEATVQGTPQAIELALTVARPRASTALETDRIAVAPAPRRFDYYSDVRWAEPAPVMLQQNLVAALESSGAFAGVVAAPARVPSELMLDVELRHFEAIAGSNGATPEVFVQVQASLVDVRRATRLASFVSEARLAAGANRRDEIIAAFEQASARVVADVVARSRAAAATAAR
jgi:cholesterol transport system auxiliary component